MRTIIATVVALTMSAAAAFAQGTAGARAPVYGSVWAANQRAEALAAANHRATTAQVPAVGNARSADAGNTRSASAASNPNAD